VTLTATAGFQDWRDEGHGPGRPILKYPIFAKRPDPAPRQRVPVRLRVPLPLRAPRRPLRRKRRQSTRYEWCTFPHFEPTKTAWLSHASGTIRTCGRCLRRAASADDEQD